MDVGRNARRQIESFLFFRTDRLAAVGAQFSKQTLVQNCTKRFDGFFDVADEFDPLADCTRDRVSLHRVVDERTLQAGADCGLR